MPAHGMPNFPVDVLTPGQGGGQYILSECLGIQFGSDFSEQSASGFPRSNIICQLAFANGDGHDLSLDDIGRQEVNGIQQGVEPSVGHHGILAVDGSQDATQERVGEGGGAHVRRRGGGRRGVGEWEAGAPVLSVWCPWQRWDRVPRTSPKRCVLARLAIFLGSAGSGRTLQVVPPLHLM